MAEDSRERTLQALERRFSVAKAELLTQQQKKGGPSDTPPLSMSAMKRNFTFSGQATLRDVEEGDPTYAQLPQTIHENLLPTKEKITQSSAGRGGSLDSILHEILQKGDSAQKYMQGSRSMKIDNFVLLDNYVQKSGFSSGSYIRALRSHSKRSKKHMSMKQHKKHGTLNLSRDLHKFDTFRPMHEMWKGYITQLLKSAGKNQVAQCLLDADLHGAIILVTECKVTSLTGVCGIVIRETAEVFGIITADNKFQVVPKKVSVFVLHIDCWKVTLQGDKLSSRKLGL